ncbi:MAG: YihY/virulence factor BrkB family protein [Lachnospira sp.]|nr:YihY/virulence factor BrkB family protein [Lachnospira sp.]
MRLLFMIQEISRKITKDNITGFAAQSCFYIILSLFPCLLVFMSLFKFLPLSAGAISEMLNGVIPYQLQPFFDTLIADMYNNSTMTLTSITAIGTIWAGGKGFMAIMQGLNIIYNTPKKRNWLVSRLMSTIYTISLLLLIITTLILLVFGNQLINITKVFLPHIAIVLLSILNNRMILFPCFMIILFLLIYRFVPTRKSSITKEFPGAVFSALGWYFFSYFYSLYIDHSPNFSYMYGSLTTLILALIWIYACMIILFLGAELNTLLANGTFRPLSPRFLHKKSKK